MKSWTIPSLINGHWLDDERDTACVFPSECHIWGNQFWIALSPHALPPKRNILLLLVLLLFLLLTTTTTTTTTSQGHA
jgi:hypothetical protein